MYATTIFPLSLALVSSVTAGGLKLYFYQGRECRSAAVGLVEVEPATGCRTDYSDYAKSFVVTNLDGSDEGDNPYMVVMFSSDDCNPATIIATTDGGCMSTTGVQYSSYEVWDVFQGKPDVEELVCERT